MSHQLLESLKAVALKEVWTKPHLDKQLIFKTVQCTTDHGASGTYQGHFHTLHLPENGKNFLVYNLGQLSPRRYGIDERINVWESLSDLATRQDSHIVVHFNRQVIANFACYITRSNNNTTYLAVERDAAAPFKNKFEDLYIRFYSNSWLRTPAGLATGGIESKGIEIKSVVDIGTIMTHWNTMKLKPAGMTYAFLNGRYIQDLTPTMLVTGDRIEVVYDGAVVGYYDLPANDLAYFNSKLDGQRKTVVMTPDNMATRFQFHDDVEYFICQEGDVNGQTVNKGFYFPRYTPSHIRQLTRQDYSLKSEAVQQVMNIFADEVSYAKGFIRVMLRNSEGPIWDVHNKQLTHDFFMLDYAARKNLISGTGAVIDEWHAAELENSGYMKWVSNQERDITEPSEVYSYYGAHEVMESAKRTDPAKFRLPASLMHGGTICLIGEDGLLKEIKKLLPTEWTDEYATDGTIEKIICVPGENRTEAYQYDLPSNYTGDWPTSYDEARFYRAAGSTEWKLARYGRDWNIDGGFVNWEMVYTSAERMVRHANKHVMREFKIHRKDLGKRLDIFSDGSTTDSGFGFKNYYVWLNNRRLIRGVDYSVDFPSIYILNEEWLVDGVDDADLSFIAVGVPPEEDAPDWGFVEEGTLSHNDTYDLYLHRNFDFNVDGLHVKNEEVAFAEGYDGGSVVGGKLDPKHREGAIYSIETPVTTSGQNIWKELGTDLESAKKRDKAIEGFLSKYFTQVPLPNPVFITHKHTVVSPVMRILTDDLLSGKLDIKQGGLSHLAVAAIFKPYTELLKHCKTQLKTIDFSYLQIVPHAEETSISVSAEEFEFLEKVNVYYLNNLIDINAHYQI